MPEREANLERYLALGWLILPCSWADGAKRPLIAQGFYGASGDRALVAAWWRRWPRALVAIRTGKLPQGSGIVVIDVDGEVGLRTLCGLIGPELPAVPRVHSRHGLHLYFAAPAEPVFSTVGEGSRWRRGLGQKLDVKADLAMCHAPGGSLLSPYSWDSRFNLETVALLPLPSCLTPVAAEACERDKEDLEAGAGSESGAGPASSRRQPLPSQGPIGRPEAYGAGAVRRAVERVRQAPPGSQRNMLNAEAYALGRLAAGLNLEHAGIVSELVAAGMAMAAGDPRNPWRLHQIRKIVIDGFRDGLRKPHTPRPGARSGNPTRRAS